MSNLEKSRVTLNESGQYVDGYGILYEKFTPADLDRFCSTLESMQDRDSRNMGALVEDCMKHGRVDLDVFPLMGAERTKLLVEAIDKGK